LSADELSFEKDNINGEKYKYPFQGIRHLPGTLHLKNFPEEKRYDILIES